MLCAEGGPFFNANFQGNILLNNLILETRFHFIKW